MRSLCCGLDLGRITLAGQQDLNDITEDYIRELFDERQLDEATRRRLWQVYYDELSAGVDTGYSPKLEQYDRTLARSLKYNVAEFSAFKETAFKKQLEAAMTENGKLLPWSKFKKKADAIRGDYNGSWLKAEYHQTVARAQSAAKWRDIQSNADLYPHLRYETVGDRRVRDKHRQWNGLVLPIDHPFWKTNFPPNDWGCRCDAIPTDEPVTDLKDGLSGTKAEFADNPGESGKIFARNPYARALNAAERQESRQRAIGAMYHDDLKRFAGYEFEDYYEGSNGGLVERFTTGSQSRDERAANIVTAKHLANNGEQIRLLPLIIDGMKNQDAFNLRTGNLMDFKLYTKSNFKSGVQNAMTTAQGQGAREVAIRFESEFTKGDMGKVWQAVNAQISNGRSEDIELLHLVFNDGSVRTIDVHRIRLKYKEED